jgi:hypothetical protein
MEHVLSHVIMVHTLTEINVSNVHQITIRFSKVKTYLGNRYMRFATHMSNVISGTFSMANGQQNPKLVNVSNVTKAIVGKEYLEITRMMTNAFKSERFTKMMLF